jgi:hypothetical protein
MAHRRSAIVPICRETSQAVPKRPRPSRCTCVWSRAVRANPRSTGFPRRSWGVRGRLQHFLCVESVPVCACLCLSWGTYGEQDVLAVRLTDRRFGRARSASCIKRWRPRSRGTFRSAGQSSAAAALAQRSRCRRRRMSARGYLHRARMLGTMSARDWAVGATATPRPFMVIFSGAPALSSAQPGGCWPLLGHARRVYARIVSSVLTEIVAWSPARSAYGRARERRHGRAFRRSRAHGRRADPASYLCSRARRLPAGRRRRGARIWVNSKASFGARTAGSGRSQCRQCDRQPRAARAIGFRRMRSSGGVCWDGSFWANAIVSRKADPARPAQLPRRHSSGQASRRRGANAMAPTFSSA